MSALELIGRYVRQRARLRLFIPLSLLLVLTGRWMVPSSSASMTAMGVAALQAFGLMLAFRIWDDLEDRDADRLRHPTRVVVTASSTAPLSVLGLALSFAVVLSLITEPFAVRRLAALSIATAILSTWYGVRPSEGRHALAEHILATKYPLFAYAVAPDLSNEIVTLRSGAALAVLYVLICVYEYIDDGELRQLITSRRSVS